MTINSMPSVGIGLPVYNNAPYLSKTLDSLLGQTYNKIIVYLVDDCSNDGTKKICAEYASRDARIKYYRNSENLGSLENHRKVLDLAETEYFMFARGHEILSPTLVQDCLGIVKKDSNVALAFGTPCWIDENDEIMDDRHLGYCDTRGFGVVRRAIQVFMGNMECFYGLTLTSNIKKVRVLEKVIGYDLIMLLEMALIGSFAHAGHSTRFRRYIYAGENYSQRLARYRKTYGRQVRFYERIFPFARLPYHLFLSVARSDISLFDKVKVMVVITVIAPMTYLIKRGQGL